jgi:hypothetical protein
MGALMNQLMIARAMLVVPPDGVSVRSITTGAVSGRLAISESKAAKSGR